MEATRNPDEQLKLLNALFANVWQSYLTNNVTHLTAEQQREINLNILRVTPPYQEDDDPYQLEFNTNGLTFANEKMKIEFDGKQISKLTFLDPDKDA